jgi:AraC-like DNA-binding protein
MAVSVIFVRGLVAALEGRARSPESLLQQLALDRSALADLRTRIGDADLENAVAVVSEQLDDDALGLTIGEQAPEHTLQLLSSLLLSCASLQDALQALQNYTLLLADDLDLVLEERAETCSLWFRFDRPMTPGRRFVADYCVVMVVRLIRRFVPHPVQVFRHVSLQRPAPRRHGKVDLFGWLPLHFLQHGNGIEFAREVLLHRHAHAHADARAHSEYRDAADAILAEVRRDASVSDRVRSVLRSRNALARPSLKQVSSLIGVQPRTLARSLSAEGKSFRLLVDETRCSESCEALRHRIPIAEVAESLGFSEPSAFHRAFRRWTGQTPAQYVRSVARAGS